MNPSTTAARPRRVGFILAAVGVGLVAGLVGCVSGVGLTTPATQPAPTVTVTTEPSPAKTITVTPPASTTTVPAAPIVITPPAETITPAAVTVTR